MTETLIIGYGNLLRGDDAVGCHAAHELEQHYRDDPEVEVIATQQLTPEMAEDVSRCGLVLFLDASSAVRSRGRFVKAASGLEMLRAGLPTN